MEQIFRVGSNISEKFVLGGTNFRGFQIKCDIYIANVWQYSQSPTNLGYYRHVKQSAISVSLGKERFRIKVGLDDRVCNLEYENAAMNDLCAL